MIPCTFEQSADAELTEAKNRFLRKKVRWNVQGETASRLGIVEQVSRRNTTTVLKTLCYEEGDPDISFISYVDVEKATLLTDEGQPQLTLIRPNLPSI